jgi:hypothetical protein
MPNNIGDVATWVTGVATIALFIVAFYQIKNERIARQKAEIERLTNAIRDQAEHLAAWIVEDKYDPFPGLWIAIRNQSLQPVYHLIVQGIVLGDSGNLQFDPGLESRALVAVVPPGDGFISIHLDYAGMYRRPGIEFAFQDALGRNWLRKSNGELTEINVSPAEYYNIPRPSGWGSLVAKIPEETLTKLG